MERHAFRHATIAVFVIALLPQCAQEAGGPKAPELSAFEAGDSWYCAVVGDANRVGPHVDICRRSSARCEGDAAEIAQGSTPPDPVTSCEERARAACYTRYSKMVGAVSYDCSTSLTECERARKFLLEHRAADFDQVSTCDVVGATTGHDVSTVNAPLDRDVVPSGKSWLCATSDSEKERSSCERTRDECDRWVTQISKTTKPATKPCTEQASAWCATYSLTGDDGERIAKKSACFASEADCDKSYVKLPEVGVGNGQRKDLSACTEVETR
jgi:hypothetical protein